MKTVGEVLAYLTEETLLNVEYLGRKKKTSKSEIQRRTRIAEIGLGGLELFKATEDAKAYPRTYSALKAREGQRRPDGVKSFYTLEETAAYVLECTYASLRYDETLSRTSKFEIRTLERVTREALEAVRALDLLEAAKKARCGRVVEALGSE